MHRLDHRSGAALEEHNARDEVGRSGIYPASGPRPYGAMEVRGQGALAHPEERKLLTGERTGAWPLLLGRAIFGGFFLYNGVKHFRNRERMTGYSKTKGVPAPSIAVVTTGAMLAAAGLSLLSGVRPKVGAGLAAAFLLGVSPVMHAFWREDDEQQRMHEMVNFTKNVALLGGALLAASVPEPWPWAPRLERG
jgi:uncharacterized membrane protein YphA (DoxX/SURF4 family)